MASVVHSLRSGPKLGIWLTGLWILTASGCAPFWDEITSHDFKVKDLWTRPPEPMVVLEQSSDGAKRGLALAKLKEPLRNGGTPEQQEVCIKILTRAVLNDNVVPGELPTKYEKPLATGDNREPLCRLGAIRALSEYKDPRASEILKTAVERQLPFSSEINNRIRLQALAALEKTGGDSARKLLIDVARSPGPGIETSLEDRLRTNDERLTAIRALAHFKHPDAANALVDVLEREKDPALRHEAHASLKIITGKNLPPDAVAWRSAMQGANPEAFTGEPGFFERLFRPRGN